MDTYGFLALAAGALIWVFNNSKNNGWKTFGILLTGIGMGIVIGAIGALLIINSIL